LEIIHVSDALKSVTPPNSVNLNVFIDKKADAVNAEVLGPGCAQSVPIFV